MTKQTDRNLNFKGFRAWGREMNKDVTPVESGLLPFVKFNKKVFDQHYEGKLLPADCSFIH